MEAYLDSNKLYSSLLSSSNHSFENRLEKCLPLSEYFIQRLSSAVGTGSLEKKANLAKKALELLSSMPKSSIKKLMEAEVAKITGLSKKDIEESSGSRSVSKK